MPKNTDISRKRDLSEKVIISLCLSLLVCMGFHHTAELAAVLGSPAGCTTTPAFTFHVEAGVADNTENLPSKGTRQPSTRRTTTTTTEPVPATPPAP